MHSQGSQRWNILIPFFVAVVSAAVSLWSISNRDLNFDEAYNLQVPLRMVQDGQYATIYQLRKFDSFTTITTGPTVLVPTYLTYLAFGVGVIQSRVPVAAYYVGLNVVFLLLALQLFKRPTALIQWVATFATVHLFYTNIVLGEIPAVFFALLGFLLMHRGWRNAGYLAIGLALVTKAALVVVLPALLLACLYDVRVRFCQPGSKFATELLRAGLVPLIPRIFWELAILVRLGWSDYRAYVEELRVVAVSSATPQQLVPSASQILGSLEGLIAFPNLLNSAWPLAIRVGLVAMTAAAIAIYLLKARSEGTGRPQMIFVIACSLGLCAGWWTAYSPGVVRHLLPAVFCAVLVSGVALEGFHHVISRILAGWLPAVRAGVVGWGVVALAAYAALQPGLANAVDFVSRMDSRALEVQKDTSLVVRSYIDRGYAVGVGGWWQAPEISFLSGGARFVNADPLCKSHTPLTSTVVLVTDLGKRLDPKSAQELVECTGALIYSNAGYQLHRYRYSLP